MKKYFTSERSERVKYFSTLEEKFRISARPCNILYIFFRTFVLRKLFDIRFSSKHCNFSPACLLVKMASKTVTRSIISIFDGIPMGIPGASTRETGAVLYWDMIALVLTFSDKAVYPPKSTSEYKVALSSGCQDLYSRICLVSAPQRPFQGIKNFKDLIKII